MLTKSTFKRVLLLFATQASLVAQQCQSVTATERSRFESFAEKWFHIPVNQHLTVIDSAIVDTACYRKLVFRPSFTAPLLVLYLTPDKTHLVSGVMDLAIDPAIAQQKVRAALAAQLVSGAFLTFGASNSTITLVVFSDFQCPYCKQFANIVATLRPEERYQLQIIYRQLPLNTHPWASDAAQISTCIALQDKSAFWKLHDFFFENQQVLSKETILNRSRDFLKLGKLVDPNKLNACLAEKQFQSLLEQDETLATDLGINSTPTVFLNGRAIGVRSVDDLRAAIQSETHVSVVSAATVVAAPAHNNVGRSEGEYRK